MNKKINNWKKNNAKIQREIHFLYSCIFHTIDRSLCLSFGKGGHLRCLKLDEHSHVRRLMKRKYLSNIPFGLKFS